MGTREKFREDFHKIKKIASKLRKDISEGIIEFPYSEDFPRGCCGSASRLLEKELKRKGFHNVNYTNGWLGEQSHAWIEYQNLIIDITADQFRNMENEEVIIINKNESDFHKQFIPGPF